MFFGNNAHPARFEFGALVAVCAIFSIAGALTGAQDQRTSLEAYALAVGVLNVIGFLQNYSKRIFPLDEGILTFNCDNYLFFALIFN
jgi:hypothetical protein